MLNLVFNLLKSRITSQLNWFLTNLNKTLSKVINIMKEELCITHVQLEVVKNSTIILFMEKNTHNENSENVLYHQSVKFKRKFDKKLLKT